MKTMPFTSPVRPLLFIDMDGVVNSLSPYLEKNCWWYRKDITPEEFMNGMRSEYRNGHHVFLRLPVVQEMKSVLDEVPSGVDKMFLTSLSKKYERDIRSNMLTDKYVWADKHFPKIPVLVVRKRSEKLKYGVRKVKLYDGVGYIYTGTIMRNVLIDDMENTIEGWNSKGGIGILHTSVDQTAKALSEINWNECLNYDIFLEYCK